MEQTKYDVFISYSTKDKKVAEGVAGYLESYGFRCFVAYRDIPNGEVWASAIADAIDVSSIMVVIFSENFNISKQTDREIELAAENEIPILTFRITNSAFSGAKKYYLKNLNWIDAFPNPNESFGKLYDNVSKLVNSKERKLYHGSESLPHDVVNNVVKNHEQSNINREQETSSQTSHENNLNNGTEIHIETDANCELYRFREHLKTLQIDDDNVVCLLPGEHKLVFVSSDYNDIKYVQEITIDPNIASKILKVTLKERVEKRKLVEEEKRRKAEQEARKKTEEEIKALIKNGDDCFTAAKYEEAMPYYLKAAERGNAHAQSCLGWIFQYGMGIVQNYEEAAKWYQKAVVQNDASAQANLGWLYLKGLGVKQNIDEAVRWLSRAVDQNSSEAQFYYGYIFDFGLLGTTNYDRAASWYKKSSDQGNTDAWFYLAYLNVANLGVKRNIKLLLDELDGLESKTADITQLKTPFLLTEAACGEVKAQLFIGLIEAYAEKYEEALPWLEKASAQNDEQASCALAIVLLNLNKEASEHVLSIISPLAENGNPIAQWILAVIYHEEDNIPAALMWSEKAVKQEGMPKSLYENVGDCYEQMKKYEQALECYEIAQADGAYVSSDIERVRNLILEEQKKKEEEARRRVEEENRRLAEEKARRLAEEEARMRQIETEIKDILDKGDRLCELRKYDDALQCYLKATDYGITAKNRLYHECRKTVNENVAQNDVKALMRFENTIEGVIGYAKKRITEIEEKRKKGAPQKDVVIKRNAKQYGKTVEQEYIHSIKRNENVDKHGIFFMEIIGDFLEDLPPISWKKYIVTYLFMFSFILFLYLSPDSKHDWTSIIDLLLSIPISFLVYRCADYYIGEVDDVKDVVDLIWKLCEMGAYTMIALVLFFVGIHALFEKDFYICSAIVLITGLVYAIMSVIDYVFFDD